MRIISHLVRCSLENACLREYIRDPSLPMYTIEGVMRSPIVRVEYQHAYAIGGIGECLAITKSKHWGAGPSILPLEPDDWFYPDRITYVYRESSPYNRRIELRRRYKHLLGKSRTLVQRAFRSTKGKFLESLTNRERWAIRQATGIEPGRFWRAVNGKEEPEPPSRPTQRELFE